jgi:hypothetical protein
VLLVVRCQVLVAATVGPVSDRVRRMEPRPVEVLHGGRWVPAMQDGWVRWDDEWRASVTYVLAHEWGRGRYVRSVPADEVRPVE